MLELASIDGDEGEGFGLGYVSLCMYELDLAKEPLDEPGVDGPASAKRPCSAWKIAVAMLRWPNKFAVPAKRTRAGGTEGERLT